MNCDEGILFVGNYQEGVDDEIKEGNMEYSRENGGKEEERKVIRKRN